MWNNLEDPVDIRTSIGGLWPAFTYFNTRVAGSYSAQKSDAKKCVGEDSKTSRLTSPTSAERSRCGCRACARSEACRLAMISAAPIPLPETSPIAMLHRPQATEESRSDRHRSREQVDKRSRTIDTESTNSPEGKTPGERPLLLPNPGERLCELPSPIRIL
jgi:hypothetical protein